MTEKNEKVAEDKDTIRPLNPETGMPEQSDIQQATEEELLFLKEKTEAYKIQGIPEPEAIQMATADWKAMAEQRESMATKAWDEVTKRFGAAEFHDDMLRRALGIYKAKWHKANPTYTLDFKLKLSALGGGPIKDIIGGAQLTLDVCVNGSWENWRKKEVTFTHIKQMREGHIWKLALYEAMMTDIISWGVTHMLNIKAAQTFGSKPAKPQTDGQPVNTESTPASS